MECNTESLARLLATKIHPADFVIYISNSNKAVARHLHSVTSNAALYAAIVHICYLYFLFADIKNPLTS